MKRSLFIFTKLALLTSSLLAADADPRQDLGRAAKALADQDNYSWTTTITVPAESPFKPGPTDGKTQKDGQTLLVLRFGDNSTRAVLKGEKAAASSGDEGWESLSELESSQGPKAFLALILRNFKTPSAQAEQVLGFSKDLKKDGDAYVAPLTDEGAKTLLTFRRRDGGDGPTVTDPKGSAKFWLKNGALTKYEFNVKGKVNFNGNEFDNDRTTTVEIKDVGSTKLEIPEAAKKKLS